MQQNSSSLSIDNQPSILTNMFTRQKQTLNISKQLQPEPTFKTTRKQNEDFEETMQFAKFIGLSPVTKIKIRKQNHIQRFFKSKSFSSEQNPTDTKSLIKTSLQNRRINYFDLKKIWEHRNKKVRIDTYRNFLQQQSLRNINKQGQRQRKICSARSQRFRANSSFQNYSSTQTQSDLQRQRVRTAKQISKRQKINIDKSLQDSIMIDKIQKQKLRRSRILKDISHNQVNPQEIQSQLINYQKWTNTKLQQKNENGSKVREKIDISTAQNTQATRFVNTPIKEKSKYEIQQSQIQQFSIKNSKQIIQNSSPSKLFQRSHNNKLIKVFHLNRTSPIDKKHISLNQKDQEIKTNQKFTNNSPKKQSTPMYDRNIKLRFKKQTNRFQFNYS